MPRPRRYATPAARQRAYRLRTRLTAVAPDALCRAWGSCPLSCSAWEALDPRLPRTAAVVTDPPYHAHDDVTRARRRPSPWDHNFPGHDQEFDPPPGLRFPEVIVFGADHYRDRLPRGGSWMCWDQLAGTTPADVAPGEWAWTSLDIPPQFVPHLWRGGQRAGEENMRRLQHKYHPAQKPVSVMRCCVQEIPDARASNHWRFGVRIVSREVYERICGMARLVSYTPTLPHPNGDLERIFPSKKP